MEKEVLNRIKAALAEANITNKELAEHLAIKPHTVSRWCTNDQQPAIAMLFQIAKYLNIDVRDLLVPNKLSSSPARKKVVLTG